MIKIKEYSYKIFIYLISRSLTLIDILIKKIFNNNQFLPLIHDRIENKQYYSKAILNKKIFFFCPSAQTLGRVESLFTKEPETLNWVNNFELYNSNKIVFWDIGSNIGLYSIYAAIKFKDIEVIAFEPSTSNLRTLSRNIFINNLCDKVQIFPLPLSDEKNVVSFFKESNFFSEGGAGSNFNSNTDNAGNILNIDKIGNKYKIYGTNIDYLIMNNIVKIPNYIKIDVDGIEHLILKGAKNLLKNNQLRELSIEMNRDYPEQYKTINQIMKDNGFKNIVSTNAQLLKNKDHKLELNETVNAIFKRIE
jgi:FkbM family methyltransferase